jgi:subtilase-type serine protease
LTIDIEVSAVASGLAGCTAAFQAVPDSTFTIAGASPARNALLLSAGPEVSFKNGLSVAASLDSETARGAHAYGGRGQVRLTW